MAIQWRKDLEIGVEKIDNQHKELVNKINELMQACAEKKGKEEVGRMIDFLGEYVVTHFSDEEALQREIGYPNYSSHRVFHINFVNDLSSFKREFENEGPTVNFIVKINSALGDWLLEHISRQDKAIGEYIRSKK